MEDKDNLPIYYVVSLFVFFIPIDSSGPVKLNNWLKLFVCMSLQCLES